jgi:peroxiredoxin
VTHDPHLLPEGLPVPHDDGAARHLRGARVAAIRLACTDGRVLALDERVHGPTVLFFYPRTGIPGQAPNRGFAGEDWDEIPGARGCTPQNCAFRDTYQESAALGVEVYGVSTQTTAHQEAFRGRNHVPFHYLSDAELELTRAMSLPTFEFPIESGGPNTLLRRMSWFVMGERIELVRYPVFPPHEDAPRMLEWLRANLASFVR